MRSVPEIIKYLFLQVCFACLCLAGNDAGTNVVIRFGIVADLHYADTDNRGSRFYRESAVKMAECVKEMNREKVAFLVELGDFKDQGKPASEKVTLEYLKTIEAEFAKFKGPRYHVLGNHDQDSISKKAFLENAVNTGIPRDQSYYSFITNGVQFIVLDANFRKDGVPYDCGNFDWKDASIPDAELKWLENTVSDHNGKSIVFIHQRLDAETVECVKNSPAVRKILSDSGKVMAVFSGHDHKGGYAKIDGIHYYILKAVIEGSGLENNAYAIVEISKNLACNVIGFRKAQSVVLRCP